MATTTKVLIHLPVPLKKKLDALKSEGYTASGFIRALLERELEIRQSQRRAGRFLLDQPDLNFNRTIL